MNEYKTEQMIPRASVENLCNSFQQAAETLRASTEAVWRANDHLAKVWGEIATDGGRVYGYNIVQLETMDEAGIQKTILDCKRKAWARIIEHCGFRALMSVEQQKQLERQLWGEGSRYKPGGIDELPDLTPETVYGWLAKLTESLPDMFTEACKEIFHLLTPQSKWSSYKTNDRNRETVGDKVILTYSVERGYGSGKLRVRYGKDDEIRALGNVFSLLDGKGPQQAPLDLLTQLKQHWEGSRGPYEDDYFQVKGYAGAGTMHVKFKRLDLVSKLNARVGGMNLAKGERAA